MPNALIPSARNSRSSAHLVQRAEWYRLLARHLPDTALFLLDQQLRILVAEGQALTANGYNPSDLEGQLITDVLTSEDSQGLVEQYRTVLRTGQELEKTYQWADKQFEVRAVPLQTKAGKPIYLMVVAIDVTERRRNERALVNAEQRSRALLEALPDAMFVVSRDWVITEAHAHPSISWPITAASVGTSVQDVGLSPVAVQRLMNALSRAVETRQPQTHEYVLKVAGEDAYFEARSVALDESQTLTVIRDITQLRQITRSLTDRTTDLEMLRSFEHELNRSLNVRSVMSRFTEYLVTATHATYTAAYLFSAESFVLSHARGMPTLLPDQEQAILEEMRLTSRPVQREYDVPPVALRSADRCHVLAMPIVTMERLIGAALLESAAPITPRQAAMIEQMTMRAAAVLQNAQLYELVEEQLREMQQLYEKVRRLEQIKTDMIRVASHDLKSPLTGMRGYLQLLRHDAASTFTSEQISYLDEIAHAADRMQHMIEGILSLDRIQKLAEDALHEVVNLRQVAIRVVHDHLSAARQAGIKLSFEFVDDDDALVMGDVFQLQEAIVNLTSNALKYTPRGGSVTLQVQARGEEVVFTVKDDGYGIPEPMQQRLFTPFYRAVTIESSRVEGTGLGLHLVKNIVERHSGRILFHSEYGKGSTFGFVLPRYREQAHN